MSNVAGRRGRAGVSAPGGGGAPGPRARTGAGHPVGRRAAPLRPRRAGAAGAGGRGIVRKAGILSVRKEPTDGDVPAPRQRP